MDVIGGKINEKLTEKLKSDGIYLKQGGAEHFNKGLLLEIHCKDKKNKKIYKQFLQNKNKKQEKLFLDYISENSAKFVRINIKNVIHKKATNLYLEFENEEFLFRVGKSHRSKDFMVTWYENENNSILSDFIPDKLIVNQYLERYFKQCEEKFLEYMSEDYKRILIIINENRYWEKDMINIIKRKDKLEYIDEIWCAFYEFEDAWNEQLEDFDGENFVGIKYIKIEY